MKPYTKTVYAFAKNHIRKPYMLPYTKTVYAFAKNHIRKPYITYIYTSYIYIHSEKYLLRVTSTTLSCSRQTSFDKGNPADFPLNEQMQKYFSKIKPCPSLRSHVLSKAPQIVKLSNKLKERLYYK